MPFSVLWKAYKLENREAVSLGSLAPSRECTYPPENKLKLGQDNAWPNKSTQRKSKEGGQVRVSW